MSTAGLGLFYSTCEMILDPALFVGYICGPCFKVTAVRKSDSTPQSQIAFSICEAVQA